MADDDINAEMVFVHEICISVANLRISGPLSKMISAGFTCTAVHGVLTCIQKVRRPSSRHVEQ